MIIYCIYVNECNQYLKLEREHDILVNPNKLFKCRHIYFNIIYMIYVIIVHRYIIIIYAHIVNVIYYVIACLQPLSPERQ